MVSGYGTAQVSWSAITFILELFFMRSDIMAFKCMWLLIRLRILRLRKDALLGEVNGRGEGAKS
jgi:hypothetical protein